MTNPKSRPTESYHLPVIRQLEAESIHVIREVAACFERPVILYSIGKDSAVLLHLARKAFHPAPLPFPLMHIDTTWKFPEMYALRDRIAAEPGIELIVETNEEGRARGANPFDWGSVEYTNTMKTQALLAALREHGFDAAFGGARRDEERSRAKERIFSFRDASGTWDPKNQRPELWDLFNTRIHRGESIRVFPLSNWTELDVWQYIMLEGIEICDLYFARRRRVVRREGLLLPWYTREDRSTYDGVPDLGPDQELEELSVRYRTLGCWPLTAAVESEASTLEEVVAETMVARQSERVTRVIDHDQDSSMETKKREGYF